MEINTQPLKQTTQEIIAKFSVYLMKKGICQILLNEIHYNLVSSSKVKRGIAVYHMFTYRDIVTILVNTYFCFFNVCNASFRQSSNYKQGKDLCHANKGFISISNVEKKCQVQTNPNVINAWNCLFGVQNEETDIKISFKICCHHNEPM